MTSCPHPPRPCSTVRPRSTGTEGTARDRRRSSIWTESSCKYTPASLAALTAEGGFTMNARWMDDDAGFVLALFQFVLALFQTGDDTR